MRGIMTCIGARRRGCYCGLGVIAFFIGRMLNKRRRAEYLKELAEARAQAVTPEAEEDETDTGEPFLLFNLACCLMLLAFGLIVLYIPASTETVKAVVARAPEPKPKPKAAPVPRTNAPIQEVKAKEEPAPLPRLKLQGITKRGENSSALIDGKTYFLRDEVGEAKLISIFESSVVLEWHGQMFSLTLPK